MEPQNLHFGGGATETLLNPLVALGAIIAIGLIFSSQRNKVITPFLLACFTIPLGQVVVLAGVHFTVLRIIIIAGLIRRATLGGSSEGKFPGGFNGVDRMVVLWTISLLVILSVQWMEMQAFIHNLGDFLDVLGGYLVVRFFIPDGEALRHTIKALAIVCIIQGSFMLSEQIIHVNLFGYVGGPGPGLYIRDGKIRSMGVLGCIPAGGFAGALIPLFVWLRKEPGHRTVAMAGFAGATSMVFTSSASTSILAFAASILGLVFWRMRKRMRLIRRGFAAILIGLHLVMKAPVWALIARVDLTGSSSGYHRYMLVDNCIRHFSDWWLLGYKDYGSWGWDMWDLCNQFVVQALLGGLLALVAYILIFSRSFAAIGNARKTVEGDRRKEWFFWCIGSTLFSIVVAHFGINYPATMEVGLSTLWAIVCWSTYEVAHQAEQSVRIPDENYVTPVVGYAQ